mmetsp:Transcript_30637/g.71853  ORF Transcript_30637/g.71853 Transcript_30637/m.71853 type:complete len:268 (+) Transcript_30637:347-1150(+)
MMLLLLLLLLLLGLELELVLLSQRVGQTLLVPGCCPQECPKLRWCSWQPWAKSWWHCCWLSWEESQILLLLHYHLLRPHAMPRRWFLALVDRLDSFPFAKTFGIWPQVAFSALAWILARTGLVSGVDRHDPEATPHSRGWSPFVARRANSGDHYFLPLRCRRLPLLRCHIHRYRCRSPYFSWIETSAIAICHSLPVAFAVLELRRPVASFLPPRPREVPFRPSCLLHLLLVLVCWRHARWSHEDQHPRPNQQAAKVALVSIAGCYCC